MYLYCYEIANVIFLILSMNNFSTGNHRHQRQFLVDIFILLMRSEGYFFISFLVFLIMWKNTIICVLIDSVIIIIFL